MRVARYVRAVCCLLSFLVAYALSSPPARAEDLGSIQGRVLDDTGSPVAGARVTASAAARVVSATSGADGGFRLERLSQGLYDLSAVLAGHAPQAVLEVAVGPGQAVTLDLTLRLLTLEDLMDIPIVSASKSEEKLSEAPATTIVLTRSDIANRGYTDVSQILHDLPGMQVVRPYGDSYVKNYWRGYRSFIGDPFLLMVDGLVQNSLYYNMVENTIVSVPLSNVERIEVVYGPASALYGANAFMGVINVITRRSEESSATLGVGSNAHRFADVTYSARVEDLRFSATFRVDNSILDASTSERYEYTRERYYSDRSLWGVFVDNPTIAGRNYSQNLVLAGDLRLGWRNFEVGYQYYDLRSGYGNEYAADLVQNAPLWHRRETSLSLRHSQTYSDTLNGTTLARYRTSGIPGDASFLDAYGDAGEYVAAFSFWQAQNSSKSFSQDFNWKALREVTVSLGASYEQRDLQKAYDNPYGVYQPATTTTPYPFPAPPSPFLQQQNRITQNINSGYGQARWYFADTHSVIVGGRADHNNAYGYATTLRVGYVGNVEGFSLKALFGQAFQEPVPRSLYGGWKGSGSDPTLKPEESHTAEFSVGRTTSSFSATGSFWITNDKNVILGSSAGATNLGNRDLNGLDVQLRFQKNMTWGGSLSAWGYLSFLLRNEGRNNPDPRTGAAIIEGLTTDGRVGDLARVQAILGGTLEIPGGHAITLMGRYVGARDTVATNPVGSVPGHAVADLVYQAPNLVAKGLGVRVKLSNITDASYFDPGIAQGNAGTTPGQWVTSGESRSWSGSQGYYSSLLAQAGREVTISLLAGF